MASAIVVNSIEIVAPGLASRKFNTGDTVQDTSPYYVYLVGGGFATSNGQPATNTTVARGLVFVDVNGTYYDASGNILQIGSSSSLPAYAKAFNPVNRFDHLRSAYNFLPSNIRKTRKAISQAIAGDLTECLFIGDSVMGGSTLTNGTYQYAKSWPSFTSSELARQVGATSAGTGFVRAECSGNRDARITLSGSGWNSNVTDLYTSILNDSFTFTTDVAGSSVDVWWYDFGNGWQFTISINGATSGSGFATVTGNGTGGIGWKKTTLTSSISSGQTLVMTNKSSGGYLDLLGIQIRSSSGLLLHNIAQAGSTAAGTNVPRTAWADNSGSGLRQSLLSGFISGLYTVSGLPPQFVVIGLGGNDQQQGYSQAQTATAITTIARLFPSSDIILIGQTAPQPVGPAIWESYIGSLYVLADSLGVPLFDTYNRMGTYAQEVSLGLSVDGQGHLLPAGNAMIGTALANLLAA